MRRGSLIVALFLTLIPFNAARAGVGAGVAFNQIGTLETIGLEGSNYMYSYVAVLADGSGALSGTSLNPNVSFTAAGYKFNYSTYTYVWLAPEQGVATTSFTMDPLGNSATMRFTLRDTAAVSHAFDVTLTRPQSIGAYVTPGLPANAFVDPSGGVSVSVAPNGSLCYPSPQLFGYKPAPGLVALIRGGYTPTGTADGNTLPFTGTNVSVGLTCQQLRVAAAVTAP